MIDDEVRECLKDLVEEVGAVSARIVVDDDLRTGVPARTLALGGGEYLRIELGTRTRREPETESGGLRSIAGPEAVAAGQRREANVEAAFERTTRQLRAIRRRWEVDRLPEITVAPGAPLPPGERILDRIEGYMKALAGVDRASNAFVTRGAQLVASARPVGEVEASRWPFLARRALATHAPGSSHGEVIDPDAYAMSFWYDATLVVLIAEPYAIDFVRHRCRQVARELCVLLPLLDPEPEAPAAIGPRPRTPTQQ